MKKPFFAAVVSVLSVSMLSGCCLMVDGKTQPVAINTNAPAMYTVKNVNGQTVSTGTAPNTVTLRRDDAPYTVELRRTDSSPVATGTITDNMNGWLWGDVFCGVIICGGVDLATGSAWDLDKSVRIDTMNDGKGLNDQLRINTLASTTPVTVNNNVSMNNK